MNKPCQLGHCRHCKPGRPCPNMRRWLHEETELDNTPDPTPHNTANAIIPPDNGRWAFTPRLFARNQDDPINDKD